MKTAVVSVLSLVLLVAAMGCALMAEKIAPSNLDRDGISYAEKTGRAEPNEYTGYPSLEKARRLKKDVDAGHQLTQLEIQQMADKDKAEYTLVSNAVASDIADSEEIAQGLFGQDGVLTVLASALGGGALLGYLGLKTRRKGDLTAEEVEVAKQAAAGDAQAKAEAATSQLTELIGRVSKVLTSVDAETAKSIKGVLGDKQSSALRETVAVVTSRL